VLVLLDLPAGGIEELWQAIGHHVTRSELEQAVATVHKLTSQPNQADGFSVATAPARAATALTVWRRGSRRGAAARAEWPYGGFSTNVRGVQYQRRRGEAVPT